MMRRFWFLLLWLPIFAWLIYGGLQAPSLKEIEEDRSFTLGHETAQFSVDLTGRWQEIHRDDLSLSLYRMDSDAYIGIFMEIGGVDYYTPREFAAFLGEALPQILQPLALLEDGAEPTENGIRSRASFSWPSEQGQRTLEIYTYHPLEGIRCYVAYLYPEGMDGSVYQEGLAMIDSITFLDLEGLYQEFLSTLRHIS